MITSVWIQSTRHLYYLLIVFAIIFSTSPVLASERTGEGVGQTEKAAILDAKRNILEREVGTHLKASSTVQDGELIKDLIVSKSEGYLSNVKVLDRKREGKERWVRISAHIGKDILSQVQEIQTTLKKMGYPRLMITYTPKPSPDSDSAHSGTAKETYNGMEEYLTDKQFDVVDKGYSQQFVEQQKDILNIDLAVEKAAKYALKHKAEYVILFEVESKAHDQVANVVSSARIIHVSTSRVLSNKRGSGFAQGRDYNRAGRRAGLDTIKEAMSVVLENMIERGKSGQVFSVEMDGIKDEDLMYDLEEVLEKSPGVTSLDERTFDGKRVVMEIRFMEKASKLKRLISKQSRKVGMKLKTISSSDTKFIYQVQ